MCAVNRMYSFFSVASLPSRIPIVLGADACWSTRSRTSSCSVTSVRGRAARGWSPRGRRRPWGRLPLHQQYVLTGTPNPGRAAGDADDRAFGVEPQHFQGIVLEVGAAVAARLETEALELARDISRHGVELRARRGAAEHRVVGADPDTALYVRGRDG